jgi:fido (protein-threonine AMPylation protein)
MNVPDLRDRIRSIKTLSYFASQPRKIPAVTAWSLADLGESLGKQALFTRQSPQRLRALREHAVIESAISSNRIEGVSIEQARIRPVLMGRAALRDRDEEEVRGYRDALRLIHEQHQVLDISQATIQRLHELCRGQIWDAGKYRDKPCDIIEHMTDGRQRVRFRTVAPTEVPANLERLLQLWRYCLDQRTIHPLVAMAGFNLDFLCIHPFRDGNGRVSRLLLLLQCYHLGHEVGRYISLERTIEQNKERYYETLELSSEGWPQGKHNPWHYINYLLFILKAAYHEFEDRLHRLGQPRGAKTDLVLRAIAGQFGPFTIAALQHDCPEVGIEMIRHVLKNLRAAGKVRCLGRGQNAQWEKTEEWGIGTRSAN